MRLFLGFFPKQDIIVECKKIQQSLQQFKNYIRFVQPKQIHLTLRFLGNDVSKKSYATILPELNSIIQKSQPFNVRIKEARFGFPGRKNPRIVYISTVKCTGFDRLLSKVNAHIDSFQRNDIIDYKYRNENCYHFTLARSRKKMPQEIIRSVRQQLEKNELPEGFRVSEVYVVKSILHTKGPEYHIIEKFPLAS